MLERRSARRYDVPLHAVVERLPIAKELRASCHAKVCDVSADGVSFIYDQRIPIGARIGISFTIPIEATHVSQVAINAHAKVVRVDEEREGIGRRFRVAASIEMYKIMRLKSAVSDKLSLVSPRSIVQWASLAEGVH